MFILNGGRILNLPRNLCVDFSGKEAILMENLKVSAKSSPNLVAGAIAGIIRESESVEIQAIGAGAVNQAIKAVAAANVFLEGDGLSVVCKPKFIEVELNGESRTAMSLVVMREKP